MTNSIAAQLNNPPSYEEVCKLVVGRIRELAECMVGVFNAPADVDFEKLQAEHGIAVQARRGGRRASAELHATLHDGSSIVTDDKKHHFTSKFVSNSDGTNTDLSSIKFDSIMEEEFLLGTQLRVGTHMFGARPGEFLPRNVTFSLNSSDVLNASVYYEEGMLSPNRPITPKIAIDILKILKCHREPLIKLGLLKETGVEKETGIEIP